LILKYLREWIAKKPFIDDVPFDKDGGEKKFYQKIISLMISNITEIRAKLPPIDSLQNEKINNEVSLPLNIFIVLLPNNHRIHLAQELSELY
jgi:hypothetical protein